MKKFIFGLIAILAVVFIDNNVMAQKRVYCELVGTANLLGTKVTIQIDYGQKQKFFGDNRMVNDEGKVIRFNSMIDALNYMGELGWTFEQAYTISHGNQNVYHFLLSKIVENTEQTEFETKSSFKDNTDTITIETSESLTSEETSKSHNRQMKEQLKNRKNK